VSLRIPRERAGKSAQEPLPTPTRLAGTIIDRAVGTRRQTGRDRGAWRARSSPQLRGEAGQARGLTLSPSRTDPSSASESESAADGED
jgi:hypothetical protein